MVMCSADSSLVKGYESLELLISFCFFGFFPHLNSFKVIHENSLFYVNEINM